MKCEKSFKEFKYEMIFIYLSAFPNIEQYQISTFNFASVNYKENEKKICIPNNSIIPCYFI